jgi:Domain of unknown function (DUF5615)
VSFSSDQAPPRFLTDEGFNALITQGLRRHYSAMDIVTLQETGLLHAPDPRVLLDAQRLNRILLSHDTHTMPQLFFDLLAQQQEGAHLPGILFVAQIAPIGSAIDWIAEVWVASYQDEWRVRIEIVSSSCQSEANSVSD